MSVKVIFSVLSGLVFLFAFFPYIRAIVKRVASPRKATWLVWATGDVIVLAGMLAKQTANGLIVCATIGAVTVFLLSLKFGEPGWSTRDKTCIALSGLAIALWLYFGESNLGIALGLVALAIAAWPTYVSAWQRPENENANAWLAFNVSNLLAMVAIPRMSFADVVPVVAFILIDTPMLYLLFVRPRMRAVACSG